MINDILARRELNRRLACIVGELEDLDENSMGLLPYEQACRFRTLMEKFRVFVTANEHDQPV